MGFLSTLFTIFRKTSTSFLSEAVALTRTALKAEIDDMAGLKPAEKTAMKAGIDLALDRLQAELKNRIPGL